MINCETTKGTIRLRRIYKERCDLCAFFVFIVVSIKNLIKRYQPFTKNERKKLIAVVKGKINSKITISAKLNFFG